MANKYKKYTQLEHVLARPDTYIGSVCKDTDKHWALDKEKTMLKPKMLTHVPGLYKIYDEILVNAIDQSTIDPKLDTIKIDIVDNSISIYNNGEGIPVEIHKEYGMYIPELIFGNLLTSSNYDDTKDRTTGGRNGFGAKLANIFSTSFEVEILDAKSGKLYKQTWSKNMTVFDPPTILQKSKGKGYAKFTFRPDFEKFGMEFMDNDTIDLFEKRAYDVCACTNKNVKVYYNGNQIKISNFEKYIDLYLGSKTDTPRVYCSNEHWEICVCMSDTGFKQVSFVNGICTSVGGSVVDYITRNLVQKLTDLITSKHKNAVIKPQFIKDHMFVFIKATIVNPSFSSQTKVECTSKPSTFGSKFEPSEDFIKKIAKLGINDEALALAKHKEMRELAKTDGKKRTNIKGIPKLDDANKAGTGASSRCTLILTEGDSAKTFAISGLSIVGRDNWGVFPLRGKLLNVRDATPKQLMENAEINAIKQILGLQQDKEYRNTNELRYGRIMILTDADVDGSHIKGLLINFIHHFWPSLLEIDPCFVCAMITPVIKVSKGTQVLSFYNLNEFDQWKKDTPNSKTWQVKYYKGLGTSTSNEAKQYFKDLQKNTVKYTCDVNRAKTKECIELAFKKENADKRKHWIVDGIDKNENIEHGTSEISYTNFINKDFIWFSIADVTRSIPSMVDGLKPSQRKVLYACRKRSNKEAKVSQLAGYISTETSYHHGEQSLMGTVISMAQDFVGSNNLNLLNPIGQFGTRLMGGKDAASPRYIYTNLNDKTHILFNKEDDPLLDYLDDDGFKIEPKYYVPTLPTILINGSEGIGTGYSSFVPCYNPVEIKKQIQNILEEKPVDELIPYYQGFTGTILPNEDGTYIVKGIYKQTSSCTLEISELPIGKWTQDYKEFLENITEGGTGTGKKIYLSNYENHSTENTVNFKLTFIEGELAKLVKSKNLEKELKLCSSLSIKNMHLFDKNNNIKKYNNVEEILRDFVDIRKEYYQKRKDHNLKVMNNELAILDYKIKFIQSVVDGSFIIFKRKKQSLIDDLKKLKYPLVDKSYEYLLGMKLWLLTEESIEEYMKKQKSLNTSIKHLDSLSANDIWIADIDKFN